MIEVFDVGDSVFCDWTCGKDYTNSDAKGGLLFGSKGVCPECAPDLIAGAARYGELNYIKATCPPDQTFKQFVLNLRNGNNQIRVLSGDDLPEGLR